MATTITATTSSTTQEPLVTPSSSAVATTETLEKQASYHGSSDVLEKLVVPAIAITSATPHVETTEEKVLLPIAKDTKSAANTDTIVAPAPSVPDKDVANGEITNKNATGIAPAESVTTPLHALLSLLPGITEAADYSEMWGVTLTDHLHVPTTIVLEKFLRANNRDVEKAKLQLISALKWRKEMQPQLLLSEGSYDIAKFGGLGFVTVYHEAEDKEIITWNLYGAVKDKKATFGNLEEFIKWRTALMEISVKELDLPSKTVPIPEGGVDQYRMIQVHDYLNISFLRLDPIVKAATNQTISTFSMAYPELLKEKFFVNVPALLGWVFAGIKLILPKETVKKFHLLGNGSQLAGEISVVGSLLPRAYGGAGEDLTSVGKTTGFSGSQEAVLPSSTSVTVLSERATEKSPMTNTAPIVATPVEAIEAPAQAPVPGQAA